MVDLNITVLGAGNSGLAMAAHLSKENHQVTLWNRSRSNIPKLMETHTINCQGVINESIKIHLVTDDLEKAIDDPDIILVTTPATSHKELAEQIAKKIKKEILIILNPGRTFGALEFEAIYNEHNSLLKQTIAETQTIIYTCRKTCEDSVDIISLKSDVLISTFNANENKNIISKLPESIQPYFIPARSMIETSIGNVGMILHCAPLLLNAGWTESKTTIFKYYYDGITPTIGRFIEKIDRERVLVSKELGLEVESTKEWLERAYLVKGDNLYQCVQNNDSYETIRAPGSLEHRYIFEDIPCGLVPLEAIGKRLGLEMKNTSLVIDLACNLLDVDFRKTGRNLEYIFNGKSNDKLKYIFNRSDD